MKRLGVFILPPGWDASPSQGYPQLYAGTHLYTWVERGTVRVKCLAQEHNTMSPARPRTRTTRSGVERTNHEATYLTDKPLIDKRLVFPNELIHGILKTRVSNARGFAPGYTNAQHPSRDKIANAPPPGLTT